MSQEKEPIVLYHRHILEGKEKAIYIEKIKLPNGKVNTFTKEDFPIDLSPLKEFIGYPIVIYHNEDRMDGGVLEEVGKLEVKDKNGDLIEIDNLTMSGAL